MQETWIRSLGREESLEKGMATHSSILAWRIPWIKEPGRLQSIGHKESDTIKQLRMHIFLQNGGIHVKINPIPIKSIETNGDIFDMQCIFVVYFCKRISQVTQW